MLKSAALAGLAGQANAERVRRYGQRVHYTHSLNINPTNVCENRCELCAFWREPGAPDAYGMDMIEVRQRLEKARDQGLTELHVVGGCDPSFGLEYHLELFRMARELLPDVLVQGLTAVEVDYLARRERLSLREVLGQLKAAGLGCLPGGGAEIFNASVRARICSNKISGEQWLAVHREAHGLGMSTNATMLFGHLETPEDIVDHLDRLRTLQDETGGFKAFVALPFHPSGTRLPVMYGPGGSVVTRIVALARLYLDNIPHIRALANYVDRKLLGVLIHSGVDDVGPTSLDERIVRAAGAPDVRRLAGVDSMRSFLESVGGEPVLTESTYRNIKATDGAVHGAQGSRTVAEVLAGALAGKRISAEQAVLLHDQAGLHELGLAAHRRRMAVVPGREVTFVLDRNLSFTNVCEAGCRFCAFHVKPGAVGGFLMSIDEIVKAVVEAEAGGATQILIQGGLNPDLNIEFYEAMFRAIKRCTGVWLHCLSPAEILFLSRQSGLTVKGTMERLVAAGLDSLPGGGAEILVDEVRRNVSPRKITAGDWLSVMETAHGLGLKASATMVYGLGETTAQRVEHLMCIRELQDRTGVFTAFIPWSFQPDRTQVQQPKASGLDYLRMVALARLVLDNVPHVQAGWVTEGPDMAQLALDYGADDFGGVLMEEKVVKATGVGYEIALDHLVALIWQIGMTPVQRTTQYGVVREHGRR
jgi:dehypoxanthine futalosine cyclase